MATLKDIRKRISSVKSTQKITRAMKMVAASKLRRSQQALMNARPYAQHMANLVGHLAALESDHPSHPLLVPREEVGKLEVPSGAQQTQSEAESLRSKKTCRLVVLTSDRGFCGGFNGNLLRRLWEWVEDNKDRYEKIQIQMIGRKGRDFFKARNQEIDDFETGVYEDFNLSCARSRAEQLIVDYEKGSWDECYYVYNRFKSAISQDVTFQKVVPLSADLKDEEKTENAEYIPDYIYEPTAPLLLEELLPRYLMTDIFRIFLDSIASEFGARMVAMDAATNNCSDMIDQLTLTGNRLRQAAITSELMDIVNGAEALR